MKTATTTDFGIGLRLALERRGTLTDARRHFAMLELLVRDDARERETSPRLPRRSQGLRLAT